MHIERVLCIVCALVHVVVSLQESSQIKLSMDGHS